MMLCKIPHTRDFAKAAATEEAHGCAMQVAMALSATAVEVLVDKKLLDEVKREFRDSSMAVVGSLVWDLAEPLGPSLFIAHPGTKAMDQCAPDIHARPLKYLRVAAQTSSGPICLLNGRQMTALPLQRR
nr:hypothetical protein B0A51_03442 [Rachicladosporium sp. CCFEE 5018]